MRMQRGLSCQDEVKKRFIPSPSLHHCKVCSCVERENADAAPNLMHVEAEIIIVIQKIKMPNANGWKR